MDNEIQVGVLDLSYSIFTQRKWKSILRNASFTINKGELCAIMGPSGAGKSTLLDLLAHRRQVGIWTGEIIVNKKPIVASINTECAYVQQDDIHYHSLTVYETLKFAAWTRMPQVASKREREERIAFLLDTLGLLAVKDSLVGDAMVRGISGGQLKRLSIGVEIIALPELIYIDEPTSGLDSAIAYDLMKTVSRLSNQGRTAVISIHQPSAVIFQLFDRLILMADGYVIYCGSAKTALEYFTSANLGYNASTYNNPAEFLLDICSTTISPMNYSTPRYPEELSKLYVNSDTYNCNKIPLDIDLNDALSVSPTYATNICTQCHMLLTRGWLISCRDIHQIQSDLIKNIAIGLITAFLFWGEANIKPPFFKKQGLPLSSINSICALLYFMLLFTFVGNAQIIVTLCERNRIYRRELASNAYSTFPHWFASSVTQIPYMILSQILLVFIAYFACQFPLSLSYFLYMFTILFLSNVTAFYIAQLLAAATNNATVAFAIFPLIFTFLCNFCGFSANIKTIPHVWTWATYVSFARWIYQGLVVNEFERFLTDPISNISNKLSGDSYEITSGGQGGLVLELLGFDNFNKYNSYWIVLITMVIVLILMYIFMRAIPSRLRRCTRKEYDNLHIPLQIHSKSKFISITNMRSNNGFINRIRSRSNSAGSSRNNNDLSEPLLDLDPLDKGMVTIDINSTSTKSNDHSSSLERKRSSLASLLTPPPPSPPTEPSLCSSHPLVFSHISYSVRDRHGNQRIILDDISGMIQAGEVVAVLGASGSGKSTLLDVLAGRKTTGTVVGHVLVNGQEVPKRTRTACAYVMQDNVHIGEFTARETLTFASKLRLPARMSSKERKDRVEALLVLLGLSEHCDTRVGTEKSRGLSGGQIKRLSIGVEIMTLPELILLDEPTSGLDSTSSMEIMEIIRKLATNNRAVLCSVHQPSAQVYASFDRVLLLAEGRALFFGPSDSLVRFFVQSPFKFLFSDDRNPADFAVAVASGSAKTSSVTPSILSSELAAYYAFSDSRRVLMERIGTCMTQLKSVTMQRALNQLHNLGGGGGFSSSMNRWRRERGGGLGIVPVPMSVSGEYQSGRCYPRSTFYQVYVLCVRVLLQNWKAPRTVIVTVLRHVLIALFYGSLYWQVSSIQEQPSVYANRFSVFFFSIAFLILGHQQSVPELFSERLLFYRERGAGVYGTVAYWISSSFVKIITTTVSVFLYAHILYYMVGLDNAPGKIYFFYIVLLLESLAGLFLCHLIASLSSSAQVAINFFPISLFISIAFSGYMRYLPSFPAWCGTWLPYLSFMRWGFQALVLNELKDNEALIYREYFIEMLGFNHQSREECIPFLVAFLIGFAACVLTCFTFVSFEKR